MACVYVGAFSFLPEEVWFQVWDIWWDTPPGRRSPAWKWRSGWCWTMGMSPNLLKDPFAHILDKPLVDQHVLQDVALQPPHQAPESKQILIWIRRWYVYSIFPTHLAKQILHLVLTLLGLNMLQRGAYCKGWPWIHVTSWCEQAGCPDSAGACGTLIRCRLSWQEVVNNK